jgi:hypothetical protein
VYTIGLDTDRIRLLGANKNPKFEKKTPILHVIEEEIQIEEKGF